MDDLIKVETSLDLRVGIENHVAPANLSSLLPKELGNEGKQLLHGNSIIILHITNMTCIILLDIPSLLIYISWKSISCQAPCKDFDFRRNICLPYIAP